MANEEVSIDVVARVNRFRDEIDKAVRAMDKEWNKARKNADKNAKETERAWKEAFNKITGAAANVAEKLGGPFARVGSLANGALKPILEVSGALGPAGLAGVAAAASVVIGGVAAAAVVALGTAAGEATERLDKLGLATLDQSLAGERLRETTAASAAATDLITVELAESIPVTQSLAHAWVGLKVAIAEGADAMGVFGAESDAVDLAGFATRLNTLPGVFGATASAVASLAAGYGLLTEKGREFTETVEEQGREMALVYGPTPDQLDEVAKAQRKVAEEARKAKAHADEVYAARMRILALDEKIEAAIAKEAAEAKKAAEASREFDESLRDLGDESERTGAIIRSMIDEEATGLQRVFEEMAEKGIDVAVSALDGLRASLVGMFGEIASAQVEGVERSKEALDGLYADQARISSQILALRREESKTNDDARKKEIANNIASLEDDREATREKIANEQAAYEHKRKTAMRAFVAGKIAAIAGVAINTSLAVMNALATVQWPGAPIAAAAMAATGAIQAGIIAAKKPPEFPMGLASPDHSVLAAIQPSERIVTSRGAKDDRAVRLMNEGRGGETAQDFTAVVVVGRREVAAASSRGGRLRVDSRAGREDTVRRRGR